MIIDELNEFADATLVTGAPATYLIGDQIDLGFAGNDIGNGDPLYLILTTDTSFIAGGAGTLTFQLASDDTAAIATNGTASIHWQSRPFVINTTAAAPLRAGDVIACIPLPTGNGVEYERFLGILAVVATGTLSAGRINAFLTHDPIRWKAYADAVN